MPIDTNNKKFGQFLCEEIHIAEVIHAALSTRPLDRVLNWISRNLRPEQVFDAEKLNQWAMENGFVRNFENKKFEEFQGKCQYYMQSIKPDDEDYCERERDSCTEQNCPLYMGETG